MSKSDAAKTGPRSITRKPYHRTLTFPLDPGDVDQYKRLSSVVAEATETASAVRRAPLGGDDGVEQRAAADQLVAAAQADLDSYLGSIPTVRWNLESCGGNEAKRLEKEHPPTTEQLQQFRAEQAEAGLRGNVMRFNEDTFPPVLIATCTLSVEADGQDAIDNPTAEEVAGILEGASWSDDDARMIFGTCVLITTTSTNFSSADMRRMNELKAG